MFYHFSSLTGAEISDIVKEEISKLKLFFPSAQKLEGSMHT